ncbi:hypothetical protein TorRG33x02_298230, partial [Trema orientale]
TIENFPKFLIHVLPLDSTINTITTLAANQILHHSSNKIKHGLFSSETILAQTSTNPQINRITAQFYKQPPKSTENETQKQNLQYLSHKWTEFHSYKCIEIHY